MHDIKAIRENPEAFDKALGRRGLAGLSSSLIALDEKRRAVFKGLIPPLVADHFIRQLDSVEERLRFREALGSLGQ